MKTALLIGATGLVGAHLLDQLLRDDKFEKIIVFTRRLTGQQHKKLNEVIINFDKTSEWKKQVKGDVLFSTLGTTLRKAGSKAAQYKIDYTYQYNFAEAAAQNGVPGYVLVSSAYASPSSKIFYSRMKGELERDISQLSFEHISIIRPGILAGDRKEKRLGEKLGLALMNVAYHIPGLSAWKPIHASIVARAMINAYQHPTKPVNEYTLKDVFRLAEMNQ